MSRQNISSSGRRGRSGTRYPGTPRETRSLGAFVKLLRAAHWSSTRAGARRQRAGLTESQFGVLEALHHVGPLDQRQLTGKLLTSPSNLTVVVDNLERDGLVERRASPDDRRRRIVHLTPLGKRRVERLMPDHVGRIVEVMGGLTAGEQDQLAALCRKLGHWARELK